MKNNILPPVNPNFTVTKDVLITYRKDPKFSDARKLHCNLPKIQTKRPNLKVFCQNDANGIANSEDPDLIWVCTVCPDLSVQKIRNIMVGMLT